MWVSEADNIWSWLERCIRCGVDRKLHVQWLAIPMSPMTTCTSLTLALSNMEGLVLAWIQAVVLGHWSCHLSAGLIKTEDFTHMLRNFLEKGRLRNILLHRCRIFDRSHSFKLFYIWLGDSGRQLSPRAPIYNLSSLMHEVDNLATPRWICPMHHIPDALILWCLWSNFLQLWIVLFLCSCTYRCNCVQRLEFFACSWFGHFDCSCRVLELFEAFLTVGLI